MGRSRYIELVFSQIARWVSFIIHMLVIESPTSVAEEHQAAPSILVQEPEEEEDKTPKWNGKGKASTIGEGNGGELVGLHSSEITVDWTKFKPPEALRDTAGTKSELVAQIIHESIDKVKARIIEEKEGREAEEEAERMSREERLRQENENKKSVEVSHVPPNEKSDEDSRASGAHIETVAMTMDGKTQDFLAPELPSRSKKRSLMKLFRRLNNISERGESSAAGASRHRHDEKRHAPNVLKKISSHGSSPDSSVHEPEVECVSCLDDFSPKDMVKAPCHSYCRPCFLRLVNTACENEQQWPPKCCLNPIPQKTIVSNVDDNLKKVYRSRSEEWDLPVSDRVYCSHPTCSVWVRPRKINRAHRVATCSAGHRTCTICRGPQHDGNNCPQDRDLTRTEELAEQEGWKRCYGCHAYVEHREACQHMTCRCGADFCYVCGARWRTCACTMEQLANVKIQAETRRQAREDRDLLEAAEIQEALRMVEEFEREEALKAEERRQRELMERIKLEEDRRRIVEIKFRELREIFTHIHELQRIIVQSDHKTKETTLEGESTAALADLRKKLAVDREKLNSVTKEKYAKREHKLKCDFAARVAEERRVEEQYSAALKAYWANRRDGEAHAAAAMKVLQRKMDDGYRRWEKWRDRELDNYLWGLREEQVIKEELTQDSERRLTESIREKQVEFSMRKTAELRWVQEVIEERGRMLVEMETGEIDNGQDIDAWFADEPPDESLMNSMESEGELRIPGAFTWIEP
ncbi:hypothetical protein GGR53DRAFT_504000 [Hypoxylon sp. FL1150]|nr:hypothetical protein GGR53DRAFT_504000 [Hypoxylon sp. FL1150]